MSGGPVAVHHEVSGPAGAPVVVLSPSLGSTLEMWEPQARALADRFRVVRYDPRGHGRSPVPEPPWSLADLGGDLLALLDLLGAGRAHLVGLSMGGMTAMWVAAHHPERVGRLALCCTSPHMPPPQAWDERISTVMRAGTAALADTVVGRWFTPDWAAAHPAEQARWRETVAATPAAGYAGCCAAIRDMDLRPDLPRITAPTLVVAGADDPSTPPDGHARVIVDGIPGARLEVLPDAAHLANLAHPRRVSELLLDHLSP